MSHEQQLIMSTTGQYKITLRCADVADGDGGTITSFADQVKTPLPLWSFLRSELGSRAPRVVSLSVVWIHRGKSSDCPGYTAKLVKVYGGGEFVLVPPVRVETLPMGVTTRSMTHALEMRRQGTNSVQVTMR